MPNQISDFTSLTIPLNFKAVFLDFDNTCYKYEPCHNEVHKVMHLALEELLGPVPDFEVRYKDAQEKVKTRIPSHGSSHSRVLYFQAMLEDLNQTLAISHAQKLERLYWESFMKKMSPIPGLVTFLKLCQVNKQTVVIISDLTTSIQLEKINALGIGSYIDYVVTSEEAGVEKPAPAPFLLGLQKSKCMAEEVIMIGDNLERDILGAQKLGIETIQIIHDYLPQETSLR